MLPHIIQSPVCRFFGFRDLPAEEAERRSMAVVMVLMVMALAVLYNLAYNLVGHSLDFGATLFYVAISLSSLAFLRITGNYPFFQNLQFSLLLLLPLALQIAHGGYTAGSGLVLAAFLSPLAAMVFANLKSARLFFVLYVLVQIGAGLWEYFFIKQQPQVAPEVSILFFSSNFIFTTAVVYFLMDRFLRTKDRLQGLLQEEHRKSIALLYNILPEETARELKRTGSAKARSYESATVMFTDFVGFTRFASVLSAEDMVAQIDFYFRAFDEIAQRHNLEKIKTVGDSYMCAGGLPKPNDTHAFDAVAAALEMRQFVEEMKDQKIAQIGFPFDMRIGIHTGPLVAGVVGKDKIAYDIWGETVNIASRMEQSCETGKINFSQATYNIVKDKFPARLRGCFPIKNMGEVDMYEL